MIRKILNWFGLYTETQMKEVVAVMIAEREGVKDNSFQDGLREMAKQFEKKK